MLLLGGSAGEAGPMEDNLNNLLQAVFALFRNLSDIGDTWGDPWGWLFPTLVALGTALAFVAGIRYVFEASQGQIRGWFMLAVVVVAFLAFAAIFQNGRDDAGAEDPALAPADE